LYFLGIKWYNMRMAKNVDFQRRFFDQLAAPWNVGRLFDYLPDTYFYAKDRRGRFVMVNQALAAMQGVANIEAMIGRTDL
jgi:hypothetical protein